MEDGCGRESVGGRLSFHSARSKASVEGAQALQIPAEGFILPHFGGNEQNGWNVRKLLGMASGQRRKGHWREGERASERSTPPGSDDV